MLGPAVLAALAICLMQGQAVAQSSQVHGRRPEPQAVAQAASVNSIAITSDPGADGYYSRSGVIEVTVTFDETVAVNVDDGTPSIALAVGDETRLAEYDRGSGTAALVFGHRLRWASDPPDVARLVSGNLGLSKTTGDEDTDGVSIEGGTIALNGGTIRNVLNEDADLAYSALPAQSGHKVDSVSPGLLLDPVVNGAALTLVYREEFDSTVSPAASVFTVTVGGNDRTVSDVALAGNAVSLTLDPAVSHGDGVSIAVAYSTSLRDLAGNAAFLIPGTAVTNETPAAPEPAPDPLGPLLSHKLQSRAS